MVGRGGGVAGGDVVRKEASVTVTFDGRDRASAGEVVERLDGAWNRECNGAEELEMTEEAREGRADAWRE